jgi:hypothetical protein
MHLALDVAGELDDLLAAGDLPCASLRTLPCSTVMGSASSAARASSSSRTGHLGRPVRGGRDRYHKQVRRRATTAY